MRTATYPDDSAEASMALATPGQNDVNLCDCGDNCNDKRRRWRNVHDGMDISQAQRVRAIQLTGDWEYAGLERLLTAESAQPGQR